MGNRGLKLKDIGRDASQPLLTLAAEDLMPLPHPLDQTEAKPPIPPLSENQRKSYECALDGVSALTLPKPKNKEEEDKLVKRFLDGLRKLLSQNDNWTFWQPLVQSLESCVRCQTCNEACPIYIASGKQEIYRPTFRAEVLRRLINKYIRKRGKTLSRLRGNDVELNWPTVARLAESAYRCTMCRRCTLHCPMGSDNGLITHELRKV